MALEKEIEINNSGIEATYWRITEIQYDLLNKVTKCAVSGYLDKEARDAGKSPLKIQNFVWSGMQNPLSKEDLVNGTMFEKCYTKLKGPSVLFIYNSILENAEDA